MDRTDRVWGTEAYLLANLIDLMQMHMWQFAAANSRHPPRKPKPMQRPRDAVRKDKPGQWPGKTIVVR